MAIRHQARAHAACAASTKAERLRLNTLRLFRWIITTSWFLFLLASLRADGSLPLSMYTGLGTGSSDLLAGVGALLSTRGPLCLMSGGMIGDLRVEQAPPWPRFADSAELRTCVCGFTLVAMGTLIGAYGDPIRCVGDWNADCLS